MSSCDWNIPNGFKTLIVNGYAIAFQERGQGLPLVLVHGSLGDCRAWTSQIDVFSKHYHTMALCLRHCYPEPWDGKQGDATIGRHAGDLAAFIDRLNAGPVHLVGHSRGGGVVLKMLSTHPHLARSAVLADPAPFRALLADKPDVVGEMASRKAHVEAALACIAQGNCDKGLEIFTDAVSIAGAWQRLPEEGKQIRRDNAWSLKSLAADAQTPFSPEDAAAIAVPILLLAAENSPPIYGMMHAALERHLQNYHKATIPDASHGMQRDNPAAFNTAVLEFLIQTDGDGALTRSET